MNEFEAWVVVGIIMLVLFEAIVVFTAIVVGTMMTGMIIFELWFYVNIRWVKRFFIQFCINIEVLIVLNH